MDRIARIKELVSQAMPSDQSGITINGNVTISIDRSVFDFSAGQQGNAANRRKAIKGDDL